MTNGCFDLFHAGHVALLQYAYDLSENSGVYVAVNSDRSVRELKGPGRPVYPERERCEILRACSYVREVFLFETEEELSDLYRRVQPHILVKGIEWEHKPITGRKWALDVSYAPRWEGISTSDIIGRIRANP